MLNSQSNSQSISGMNYSQQHSVADSGEGLSQQISEGNSVTVTSLPIPLQDSSSADAKRIPTTGYFRCWFFPPRAGTAKSKSPQDPGQPHRLTVEQQQLCDSGRRECTWSLRYGRKSGSYYITNPQDLHRAHTGHRLRATNHEREPLHTIKNVPEEVIARALKLLLFNVSTTTIRTVSPFTQSLNFSLHSAVHLPILCILL
jgi:hypothetical protein